jgi:hypothetical protein
VSGDRGVSWDRGVTLAERFRAHAGDSRHLYGYAMRAMAADWEARGPVREVCAGHEDAPSGSALQLRLLAGVFRLVLADEAPGLRPYYACLGGDGRPEEAWPAMREVIAGHVPTLRAALDVAPQTNEVGRAAALLVGLFQLVAETGVRRVRLLELGASAGLNLLVDRFRVAGSGWRWGPVDSPLQLLDAVEGPVRPEALTVVERTGCDLAPVDATTVEGSRLLTSFVWPFDLHRHARLRAALEVARDHPVRVDRAAAGTWLPDRLAEDGEDADHLTVVWHSVTQLYWPAAEVAAVDTALAAHGRRHRVAEVAMEFEPEDVAGGATSRWPTLRTRWWDPAHGPGVRETLLGTVHDHGLPVRLRPGAATAGSAGPRPGPR